MNISTTGINTIGYWIIGLIGLNLVMEAISFIIEVCFTVYEVIRSLCCKNRNIKKVIPTNSPTR
jgi:hypothetical protein